MTEHDLRRGSAFLAEGWTSAGLARAVANGTLERIRRDVYAPMVALEADDETRRLIAATCKNRHPDAVVSHTSALLMHRLPVRHVAKGTIHLSRSGPEHGKSVKGVKLHRAEVLDTDVVVIEGVRVTSLERTLVDVGRTEPYEWAVAAADAVLRRSADADLLSEMIARAKGLPGVGRLRQALAFADPRSGSVAESMSRVSMARAGLPAPELQVEIVNSRGEWVATSDFGWRALGVVGETDGRGKYVDDPGRQRTAADVVMNEKTRDQGIVDAGWWPVHWGWDLATDHVRLGDFLRGAFRQRRERA